MLDFILAFVAAIRVFFRSRVDTSLEVLALRQQVAVLKRKGPRPALTCFDRFFWTPLRQLWPRWSDVLIIARPKTVVAGIARVNPLGPVATQGSFVAAVENTASSPSRAVGTWGTSTAGLQHRW